MLQLKDFYKNIISEALRMSSDQKTAIGKHTKRQEDGIHKRNKVPEVDKEFFYNSKFGQMTRAQHDLASGYKNPSTESKEFIRKFDSALDKTSMDKDTHVYTAGENMPDLSTAKKTKDGKMQMHLPSYTSTSTNFHFVHDSKPEGDHIFKIHLPQGTKAGSVRHATAYPHENEIFLHRGHNIEIHRRPTVMKDGTHVWHATVVGHSPTEIK